MAASYLAFELDLLFILYASQYCEWDHSSRVVPTLYGAYHFASLVFPLQVANVSRSLLEVVSSSKGAKVKHTAGFV